MTTIGLALPTPRITWLRGAVEAKWMHLVEAWRLRETRRYIEQMDDRMLADIGVSRAQALFEIDRATRWR